MVKKYNMQFINDKGQRIHPVVTEGFSWKMKILPEEREFSLDNGSENIYKA